MIAPAHSLPKVYQLEIVLRGSEPRIWRRVLVPGSFTLPRLHKTIQIAMGWENSHLHEFIIAGRHYGEPDPDYDSFGMEMLNHRKFKLEQVAPVEGAKFEYVYDFGDGWRHDLTVESIAPPEPERVYPVCLAGEQACPIEDSGALRGYYEKIEIAQDPDHPDHEDVKAWMPRDFDPSRFDLEEVNRKLSKLAKR